MTLNLGPMACNRQKVNRWETWGVVPEERAQRALAHMLGVAPDRIAAEPWPLWLPAWDGRPPGITGTADATLATLDALGRDTMDRRAFLIVTGAGVAPAIAGWADAPEGEFTGARDGERVGASTIEYFEGRLPMLRSLDDQFGGAMVAPMATADLHALNTVARRCRFSAETGTRLNAAIASYAQILGWSYFDLGRQADAQIAYLRALDCARAAGDPALGANVLAKMAFQATMTGHARDALTAINAAKRAVDGFGDSLHLKALLASRAARAHAKLGDAAACYRALGKAEAYLDAADSSQAPQFLYYLDGAELEAQVGACLLDLGEAKAAETRLGTALAAQNPVYVRDHAIYLTRAAAAVYTMGELEHACQMAGDAAELARHSTSPRAAATVRALRARMTEHAHEPAVRALDEHLVGLAA